MSSEYSRATKYVAFLLVLCFLIFVIPSPQVCAVAAVDDAAYILLALLASFGITVTSSGGFSQVGPWIIDQFEDFVDSIGDSFDSAINALRVGVDASGNFIASPASLGYSARFALALQNQYNLTDNTSAPVSGPSGPAGFVYEAGMDLAIGGSTSRYPVKKVNDGWALYFIGINSGGTTYGGNWDCVIGISDVSFDVVRINNPSSTITRYTFDFNNRTWYVNLAGTNPSYGGRISGNPSDLPVFNDIQFFTPNGALNSQAVASVLQLYWTDTPSTDVSDITINSGTLDIPSSIDYDSDDGILIDGLGDWGDSLDDIYNHVGSLTFPDSVPDVDYTITSASALVESLVSQGVLTTENSPVVFNPLPLLDGGVDLGFGNLWHYVTDWVTSFSAGIALIGGIMFSLPLVAAFYAILVILIVFSVWRLLKNA